jgi:hypothetical protein
MKWVEVKMKELGVLGNDEYKITCMLDHAAMVTVQVGRGGLGASLGAGGRATPHGGIRGGGAPAALAHRRGMPLHARLPCARCCRGRGLRRCASAGCKAPAPSLHIPASSSARQRAPTRPLPHATVLPARAQTERYGVFDCKPLGFVWAKFPEHYNEGNTVMLDDLR